MNPGRSTQPEPSDEALVGRTRSGEKRAFDLLVERYQRRATSVAYRLVGNLHDALEVCQDAFVRAYRNLDGLEEQSRFGPWLLRIVTNLSLNFRRDRAVGGRKVSFEDCILRDEDGRAHPPAEPQHSDGTADGRLATAELTQLVQTAIGELPDTQRTALVLFSIEQMPQKEVATIMGCSVEAVKWHVFQARKTLRERLAGHV